jgi:hypothetical protein
VGCNLADFAQRQDLSATRRALRMKANGKKQKPEKKKLSGYANRMARRKRLAKMYDVNAKLIALPTDVIKMPYIGRLQTIGDWHVQVARIYRRMVSGQIPEHVGTKLVYVCTAGAQLARMLQELRETEGLRQAFERAIEQGLLSRDALPPAFGGEYIGKDDGPEDDDPMIHHSKHRSINS